MVARRSVRGRRASAARSRPSPTSRTRTPSPHPPRPPCRPSAPRPPPCPRKPTRIRRSGRSPLRPRPRASAARSTPSPTSRTRTPSPRRPRPPCRRRAPRPPPCPRKPTRICPKWSPAAPSEATSFCCSLHTVPDLTNTYAEPAFDPPAVSSPYAPTTAVSPETDTEQPKQSPAAPSEASELLLLAPHRPRPHEHVRRARVTAPCRQMCAPTTAVSPETDTE